MSYFYNIINYSNFNLNFIRNNKPNLISFINFTNYTAGITFIAVAATNLFHQGNWQEFMQLKIILS